VTLRLLVCSHFYYTCTHSCTQREIKILADLGDGHLNIVHADEVLLTRTHVGLVMEYVSGEFCVCLGGGVRGACRAVCFQSSRGLVTYSFISTNTSTSTGEYEE